MQELEVSDNVYAPHALVFDGCSTSTTASGTSCADSSISEDCDVMSCNSDPDHERASLEHHIMGLGQLKDEPARKNPFMAGLGQADVIRCETLRCSKPSTTVVDLRFPRTSSW